jgi:hypothetical protein
VIKASGATADGTPVLVLGLSAENSRRLHAGQPIQLRADHVDPRLPELSVLLVAGDTEDSIATELRELFGDVIHDPGPDGP